MNNKGQMFLITATIIIVILVLLRTSINLPDILQNEKELNSKFEKRFFQNTVNELVKVVEISYHQSNNITNNVYDFGNFTRKKMTERLQNFNFLYIGVITPSSQGSDAMNVTILNLLNKNINVNLTINGTSTFPEKNFMVTEAKNDTVIVTEKVNVSDNNRANETCSGGAEGCTTPYIYINFTTNLSYTNAVIEGYYVKTPGSTGNTEIDCWNGNTWIGMPGSDLPETVDGIINKNILSCSNSNGNYTFRFFGIQDVPGFITFYLDHVYLNTTYLDEYNKWDTNFTITQGQNYVLTVNYDNNQENISIGTKVNKSIYVGFFDITLTGSTTTYKDKFQKNYTLP